MNGNRKEPLSRSMGRLHVTTVLRQGVGRQIDEVIKV